MTKKYIADNIFLQNAKGANVSNDTGENMISDVLKSLLNERDMTLQELAEKANLPMETVRNVYYAKVTDPKISTLKAIAKVFNVSINYLTGEPFMDEDEVKIIEYYRKCGKHGKSRIRLVAKNEAKATKKEKDATGKHEIPCLVPKKRVDNGFLYEGCGTIYIKTSEPDAYAAIEVTNNSYAAAYCKGDQVLLEDRYPEHGEMAVFVRDGVGFARTYLEENGKCILRCIVGRKEDIVLKRMDEVECIGTCIGVIRT